MYDNSPDFHAAERRHSTRDRQTEDARRRRRDGSEPMRAKSLPPRTKSMFALAALIFNGALAVLAYLAGFTVAAVILAVIAVAMLVDLAWQGHKIRKEKRAGRL